MLLFALWATLVLAALAGAGYSHYRYRETRNRYYALLFARDRQAPVDPAIAHSVHRAYLLPVVTLGMVAILVPLSMAI